MFQRNHVSVWLGILLLSGMFLLGQNPWPPPQECMDNDGDGYGNPASALCTYSGLDCNDGNPNVNPGAIEGPYGDPTCGDTLDNDCDGHVDGDDGACCECVDGDDDGYGDPACENCTHPETDCDDSSPDVNPGAFEGPHGDPTCSDTLDNDCDGYVDGDDGACCECVDGDSDGYGDPGCENCTHPETDCDDSNPDVNPGATEGPPGDPTCIDALDNDCDGDADSADGACVNGIILAQELDPSDQGYTVLRVWGSHYDMGYAHATLLGDSIVQVVDQFKELIGSDYGNLHTLMAAAVWQPPEIEDEFEGMTDSLADTHPSAGIDELDLKVINTFGDWGYQCRSHTCWGRYVEEPIKTLTTRRLDQVTPIPEGNHHVLCAWDPDDGSPEWVNLAWPGFVTVATAVNEFGTLSSLNTEFPVITDLSPGRMSRMVAARLALTFPTGPDLSTHLADVFAELQDYESMTNGFLTYYTPQGHGGVMTYDPTKTGPDYYDLRLPQTVWHHGEAMITTNKWTDGTFTPPDEDFLADVYYNNESPKTLSSHWDLLAIQGTDPILSMHMLSVAYRGRGDMTLWADGRLDDVGRTPRLEWEWSELFGD